MQKLIIIIGLLVSVVISGCATFNESDTGSLADFERRWGASDTYKNCDIITIQNQTSYICRN